MNKIHKELLADDVFQEFDDIINSAKEIRDETEVYKDQTLLLKDQVEISVEQAQDFSTNAQTSASQSELYYNQTVLEGNEIITTVENIREEASEYAEEARISELNAKNSEHQALLNSLFGSIAIPTDTPEEGVEIYNISTAGTYTNFGGVVVSSGDISNLVQLRLIDGVWTKVVYPISGSATITFNDYSTTDFVEQGYYSTTGVFTSALTWRSAKIPVPNVGSISYKLYGAGSVNAVSFFTSNGTYISGTAFTAIGERIATIAIPASTSYITVSTQAAEIANIYVRYTGTFLNSSELGSFLGKEVNKRAYLGYPSTVRPNTLAGVDAKTGKHLKKITQFPTNGFYTNTGGYTVSAAWGTITVPVQELIRIKYKLNSTSGARLITFFNAADTVVGFINTPNILQYYEGEVTAPIGTVKMSASINRAAGVDSFIEFFYDLNLTLQSLESSNGNSFLRIGEFPDNGVYPTSLVYNTSSGWGSLTFPIEAGDTINYSLMSTVNVKLIVFFNSAGEIISSVAATGSTPNLQSGSITAPTNSTKFTASITRATPSTSFVEINKNTDEMLNIIYGEVLKKADSGYPTGNVVKNVYEIENLLGNILVEERDFLTNGFYTSTGTYNAASTWGSMTIPIKENEVVNYYLNSTSGARLVTFFDATDTVVGFVNTVGPLGYKEGTAIAPVGAVKAVVSKNRVDGDDSYISFFKKTTEKLNEINALINTKEDKVLKEKLTVSKTLVSNGTTIFNTLKEAVAVWKTGNIIEIHEGVYEEHTIGLPDKVYIKGIGRVELRGYLPVTATSSQVDTASTLDWLNSGTIENLIITSKNMRYPIHSDFGNTNSVQRVINCKIIHYGNQEIYKYRVDNNTASPNSASQVWRAQSAWGCGTMSGAKIYLDNSYFESPMRSFSTHNNVDYNIQAGASYLEANNCDFISHGIDLDGTKLPFEPSVSIQSLASFTKDTIVFNNCTWNGLLTLQSSSADHREFTQDLKGGGNSSHLMQIRHTVGSNKGMTYQTTQQSIFNIKISASTSENMSVSGNGAVALFGDSYISFKGSEGLPSYIKAQLPHSLSVSQLNAIPTTKILTITAGNVSKEIVLNSSYATGAAMVADITAKSEGLFIAELYWSGFDWFPNFTNEVSGFINKGSVGIKRGRAVKKSGYNGVALMTNLDNPSDFLGIALEDISVNKAGKCKYKGYMLRIWVDGLWGTTLSDGDNIKVNFDGTLSKSVDNSGPIVSKCVANENISINI